LDRFQILVKRRSLTFILITIFVDILGYSMMIPLLPFFVQKQGGGAATAGALASLYAFLQLFSGPVLGSLSDRVGRKPILLVCLFGTAIAYACFGLASSLLVLFLAVSLDGLTGNNLTTSHAYIADMTTPGERSRGLSLAGAAFGLGVMSGPVLSGFLSSYGLAVPAFVAAGIAFANTLYGLFLLPESLPREKRTNHPISFNAFAQLKGLFDLRAVRFLLIAIFTLNLAFSGLQTNFPLFSNARFGWTPQQNGFFFAFVGVVAVLVQGFLYVRLQPRFGEQRLAAAGLVFLSLGMAGIALTPISWTLYLFVAVAALGSGASIPSLSGMVSARVGESRQGQLMGGMQTLLGLTTIVGPTLAGLSFERLGVGAPYWIGSGFALLALLAFARSAPQPVTD
jgi:MFS family permease